jgi:hypothetical protein
MHRVSNLRLTILILCWILNYGVITEGCGVAGAPELQEATGIADHLQLRIGYPLPNLAGQRLRDDEVGELVHAMNLKLEEQREEASLVVYLGVLGFT